MTRVFSWSAAVVASATLLAAQNAFAIDPGRAAHGQPLAPQPQDPFVNPFISGAIAVPAIGLPGVAVPAASTLPAGVVARDRSGQPSTIPASAKTTLTTTNGAANADYSVSVNGATRLVAPSYVPPGHGDHSHQPARWKLGVYSKDTDTGVRIMQVVPNSAAQRAGIEAEDIIVCVAGYQVGYVNGVPYDCGREFERNADTDGWVTILVRNHRDGRLVNLPIQLDARFDRVDGSITYREHYSLPRDAVTTVELREILRPGAPPVTLARKTVTGVTTAPIPFSLDFDPSQIDPRRSYVLHATITSGNHTLFTTRRSFPVINQGGTKNVALLVESAVSTQPGNPYVNRDQQIEQIVQWYREYLHRDPRAPELYVWQSHVDRGNSLYDAQAQILSTPEFYNRCDSNDVKYVQQLHESILGKQPTQEELAYWLDRMEYNNRLRPEVAREFLAAVGVQR
jgi:uncharacterized lipoprotein YbaY